MPAQTTDHFVDSVRPPSLRTRTTSFRHDRPLRARCCGLAAAAIAAALPMVATSPAAAGGRVVHPGESIQAAIDAARPGDTIRVAPGTYHESITIATDDVTLAGSGPDKTHIVPPAEANGPCAAEHFGVCIFGQFDENFNVVRPVAGVHLSNLSVSGFAGVAETGEPVGVGVFVLGGHNTTVDHVVAADNGVFGFTSIFSSGDRYRDDTAYDNGHAGFQIAMSAGPGARLQDVVAYNNRFGIAVPGASGGVIVDADLHDNCLGAIFAHGASQWEMKRSEIHNNNRVCGPLPSGDPPASGGGVAIIGADHITIRLNTVTANRPAADSAFAGGIIVGSAPNGDPSNNITVTNNEAEGNGPADIIWDGTGTAITFTRNGCDTSLPGGFCD